MVRFFYAFPFQIEVDLIRGLPPATARKGCFVRTLSNISKPTFIRVWFHMFDYDKTNALCHYPSIGLECGLYPAVHGDITNTSCRFVALLCRFFLSPRNIITCTPVPFGLIYIKFTLKAAVPSEYFL